MIRESSGWLWENEISPEQDLTFSEFQRIANAKRLPIDTNKFKNLHILNKDNKYTNLGLLVSDQNPIQVKFAVYDQNLNFQIKKEFSGSIIDIAEALLKFAELFNYTSAKILPDQINRGENKSFPGPSLREAIMNAICHCEYSAPSNIKVEFFPDKAKITNPGNIYNQGTIEDIKAGIQSFRNPSLVIILNRLGYIENYGTGIQRIFEACKDKDKVPSIYTSSSYFQITLPNLNYHSGFLFVPEKGLENEPQNDLEPQSEPQSEPQKHDLTELEGEIIRLIIKNPNITKSEMAKTLNVSSSKIKRIFKNSPIIKHTCSSKNGRWELKMDSIKKISHKLV